MLYDDSEQLEVRHVISLSHHEVGLYGGGDPIPEGELWIRRNAISLTRKTKAGESAADESTSRPFYLFSENCSDKAGAMDYMKFAAQDKYVASVARDTTNIPATDAAAAQVKGYEEGGANRIFLDYAKEFAVLRPVTPGYPFIATEFAKTAQDIINGADPKQALDNAVKNIDANQKSNGYFE